MSDEQSLSDVLFELTRQHKWKEVVEKYKEDSNAHKVKLTKSEDTAFHIAIYSYNSKSPNRNHERYTEEMISSMKESGSLDGVLKMRNVREDTPLHLAAAVGWDAIIRKLKDSGADCRELIKIRNLNGETPLFVAAHHGNFEAFSSLHDAYLDAQNDRKPDESLCRRKDGNTVLHSAISGEYFRLAYLIMDYYKNLLNCFNVDGETPLHVLARKPNVFKSSSQLGFYESIIYQFVFVDDLKKQLPKHSQRGIKNDSTKKKFPKNYWTCVDIFFLLWDPIYKSYQGSSRSKKGKSGSTNDVEKQRYVEHGVPIHESFLANCSRSKKQNGDPSPSDEIGKNQTKGAEEESKYYGSFPPNYTTCISIFKFASKVILTVLGIGFLKIKKIQEKKVRHSHAMEILNQMVDFEPSYKYDSNGQRPIQELKPLHSDAFAIPDSPPNAEDHDSLQTADANITTDTSSDQHQKKNADYTKEAQNRPGDKKPYGVVKDTPLLVATKMGIPEMVKKILSAVTVAIQDEDSDGKNVMVAAENRQTSVFYFLVHTKEEQNQPGEKKPNGVVKDTPLLVAAKMGIPEMVEKILSEVPVAIQDEDSDGKNVLMVAAENRQTSVFDFLVHTNLPDYVFQHVDKEGNSILHLAAKLGEKQPWRIPGAALQMQWEIKWYKYVKSSVPPLYFCHHNAKGETPRKIFTQTHENLVKSGNEWLIKTSESCSVVAALIATVAFATSATVPGGLNQERGYPILKDHTAFDIFSIASLIALCLSITALVFFLAIITSRFEERDFKRDLPRKLLMGLSCLFSGIAAMLLSFCAGHTFILREKLRIAAVPIYAAATIPVTFFAIAQLPLYFDLLWAACRKVPLRSYKVFHQ